MSYREKLVGTFCAVRNTMNGAVETVEAMPRILRLTCLANLFVGFFIFAQSVLQFGSVRIFGERLTWDQLRSEGYRPFFVICGIAMIAAGLGMMLRRGWSRWLVVFLYVFFSPIQIIYVHHHPQSPWITKWEFLAEGTIWAGFFYWYLFHKTSNSFA